MEKLPIHFSRLAEQIYVGMKFLPLNVQHKSAGGIFNHLRKFLTKKPLNWSNLSFFIVVVVINKRCGMEEKKNHQGMWQVGSYLGYKQNQHHKVVLLR